MSVLEAIAALFGLVNIILIVRRSVWNFPAALIMVSLTGVVLWDARLYSDAGLQIFFFIVNLLGWVLWHRHKGAQGEVKIDRLGLSGQLAWVAMALSLIWGWGRFMATHSDASFPFWDASIAVLSICAQIMMTRRYINNWHWWIVINILSIGLYWQKQLYWFTGLYVVFLGMAIWGLVAWREAEADQKGRIP
jgi:nicotinamide mononucleotide transporter